MFSSSIVFATMHLFADDMQGASSTASRPTFVTSLLGLELMWRLWTTGARRSAFRWTPRKQKWCGLGLEQTSGNSRLSTKIFPSDPTTYHHPVVRDLGVFFNSELNISRIIRTCFYNLRRLRAALGQEITARLVSAFVLSRLDYCNALLAWLSNQHQHSHHCNGWCTQLLDLYAAFQQVITWHQHSYLSIGCQLSRGLNSSSACLSIRPSMEEHPPTSRTWSWRRHRYLAVPSPSLHHASGISCQ